MFGGWRRPNVDMVGQNVVAAREMLLRMVAGGDSSGSPVQVWIRITADQRDYFTQKWSKTEDRGKNTMVFKNYALSTYGVRGKIMSMGLKNSRHTNCG